jgi:hypothetical protein
LEISHNLITFFSLTMATDAVGMAVLADKSVEIPFLMEVTENTFHQLCFAAAKRNLTSLMFVASKVRKLQHLVCPLFMAKYLLWLISPLYRQAERPLFLERSVIDRASIPDRSHKP